MKYFSYPYYIQIGSIGGHKAIMDYVSPLLDWAVDMLCTAFSTHPLEIPDSMRSPYMRIIGCPHWLLHINTMKMANDFGQKMCLEEKLNCKISIFSGGTFIRISANIYNSRDDYIKFRDIILKYKQ